MRGFLMLRTAAAGLGLALLLGQGAQAQSFEPSSSGGGFNARQVVATENAYRLRDRLETMLRHDTASSRVVSLAMTPGRTESHQLCGVAMTGAGRFALFHVTDSRNPEGSISLTPISSSLNGMAVAHNDVYAQCGGVGQAVFIMDGFQILD